MHSMLYIIDGRLTSLKLDEQRVSCAPLTLRSALAEQTALPVCVTQERPG